MHVCITLRFAGTRYHGFQVQKNALSVCEVLQNALESLYGVRPPVKGCSRTDSGVHALGYCVSYTQPKPIPPRKLPLAVNRFLPDDVRVTEAHRVPEDFHARYAAHTKTYLYRIHNHPIDSPFDAAYYTRVPRRLDEAAIAAMGAKKADLDTLLAESDVVSLHAPALDSTRHMINGRALSLMKDRAILINTARGALVDEEALAQALRGGKLKYACLDVTDPEPPAADSPLRGIPNCIMTPHLAGLANNGKLKIGAHVADEIGRFLTGGTLVSEITQAMLATIA